MIELRLLGPISLTGPGREELPAILRQPKRLALLAYLAAAMPRGFHRRDTLLALFWPERDTEHARAALSDALYVLRRALGDGVILRRGDEEVGLAPGRFWCDAVGLLEAVGAGRWEEAVRLYRGEFLAGFHLSGAAEFDRWLEEQRTHVRDRVTQAGWALADQEAARGRLPDAARWARQAVALSPYQESGIRRLMALLDGMGERAVALSEYERFAARLSSDLEVEPSSETVALADSLRAGRSNGGRDVKPPLPLSGRVVEGPAPPLRPPPPDTAHPRASRLSRVVAVVLCVLGLAVLGLRLARPNPPAPTVSPRAIAILPFSYRGSPAFSYLSEGMVDLLSAKLEGTTGVRPVDSRALLAVAGSKGVDDPRRGDLVARRFGAGVFVLGSVTEAGGRLEVSTTVYEAGARRRSSFAATARNEEEIFDLADRLAGQILVELQDRPRSLARGAGQSTTSLPALKAYLEGEREMRAGRFKTAEGAFRRAVESDTAFALAYYRLANLTYDQQAVLKLLDDALRHGDRLAEHHRWMVEAMAAFFRGDHTTADQRVRQIVTVRPDDPEGWLLLAYVTVYKGYLVGRVWVDAREAFERALALGPEDAEAVWWLAAIAATEHRHSDLDSLTNRLLRLNPVPWLAGNARGQRAIVIGDTVAEARFVADLRQRPDPWAQSSAGTVAWTTGDFSAGRRLWRLITEPHRSRGFRMMAHMTLAKFELTSGRWDAASDELDALAVLDAGAALEHRAYYALTRFLQAPRSELVALRDSLRRWNPSSARTEGDGLIATHHSAHPYLRLYLLGMLSARLRESSAALGYAAELERTDRSSPLGSFAGDQALFVRAEVAWLGRRREEALTRLDQARYWTTDSRRFEPNSSDSPFFIQLHERFARAELLYELGRHEEALPWYRAMAYDFLYTGPAHLRMAQIYERRGNRREAIEHYSRFLKLWRNSDPALQPLVQQARDALARFR